jgi:hypothetical protein
VLIGGRSRAENTNVVVTTGVNTRKSGLDVVVDGPATCVTGREALSRLAEAYRKKHRDEWDFDNDDKVFDPNGNRAHVLRVAPAKVIAFAKSPHGQTTFRFQTWVRSASARRCSRRRTTDCPPGRAV